MKKILLTLLLLLLAPFANAMIESYESDFTVSLSQVFVSQKISLDSKRDFSLNLPEDADDMKLFLDGKETNYSENISAKNIELQYTTGTFVEKQNFMAEISYPENIKSVSVKVVLPADATLLSPYDEMTGNSNSIFPKPTRVTTDGQHVIIIWKKANVEKGDSLPILVKFREKSDYSWLVAVSGLLIIGLAVYILIKKPKIQIKTIVKKEDMIEKHLKEDEEQIVNILKQRENQCEQGTLRVITGFSKAKLSGLLKELEDRKIIHKENRGKKNVIFLKKQ